MRRINNTKLCPVLNSKIMSQSIEELPVIIQFKEGAESLIDDVSKMTKKLKCNLPIIHGFAGGTYDLEDLANYLELSSFFDVYQFTLPGHEKNLSKVKYEDWIKASEEKVEMLINRGYKNIYLIGHSMGGVIATYLATKYRNVKNKLLLA